MKKLFLFLILIVAIFYGCTKRDYPISLPKTDSTNWEANNHLLLGSSNGAIFFFMDLQGSKLIIRNGVLPVYIYHPPGKWTEDNMWVLVKPDIPPITKPIIIDNPSNEINHIQ